MQIGIIGTGNVGEALAKRLVEVGHHVKAANSRGAASLQEFAQRTRAEAADVNHVAFRADVVIIAVPINRVRDLPKSLFQSLPRSAVVVDTTNYVPSWVGTISEIDRGLTESAWVSEQIGVPVIKAFNSMTAFSMGHKGRPKNTRDRIALPVAGDNPDSRLAVIRLVEDLGFTGYNAGAIADSWRQQPGQPAYATDPSSKELPALLARANRQKAPKTRDNAMKLMAKLPADFPASDLVRVARLSVGLDVLSPKSWFAMLRLLRATAVKQR